MHTNSKNLRCRLGHGLRGPVLVFIMAKRRDSREQKRGDAGDDRAQFHDEFPKSTKFRVRNIPVGGESVLSTVLILQPPPLLPTGQGLRAGALVLVGLVADLFRRRRCHGGPLTRPSIV
jgi:hypothetical protein